MKSNPLILAILIIAVTAGGWFVGWPTYQNLQKKVADLTRLEKEVANLQAKEKNLSELVKHQAQLRQKAVTANELFPLEEKREDFANQFDALVKNYSLVLSTLNFSVPPAPVTKKPPAEETEENLKDQPATKPPAGGEKTVTSPSSIAKEIKFTAVVTGEYINIKQLITNSQAMKRFVTLKTLTLSKAENGLAASIEGVIYTRTKPAIPDVLTVMPESWQSLDRQAKIFTSTIPAAEGLGRPDPFAPYK